MRVYHVPSLDGLVEAIVAAGSLDAAAAALGMSVRSMRELKWQPSKGGAATRAAKQPERPLYRNIVGRPGAWDGDRAKALAKAARAAKTR